MLSNHIDIYAISSRGLTNLRPSDYREADEEEDEKEEEELVTNALSSYFATMNFSLSILAVRLFGFEGVAGTRVAAIDDNEECLNGPLSWPLSGLLSRALSQILLALVFPISSRSLKAIGVHLSIVKERTFS